MSAIEYEGGDGVSLHSFGVYDGTRYDLGKFQGHFVVLRSYDEGHGPTQLRRVPNSILLKVCKTAVSMGIDNLTGICTQMLMAHPCTRSYFITDRMENLSEWIRELEYRVDSDERNRKWRSEHLIRRNWGEE